MVDSDSEFVRHMACTQCGSSDANSLYSDGHTHCFRCGHHTNNGINVVHTHKMPNSIQLSGEPVRIASRKISQKTAEFFKTYKDGSILRHYYYNVDGTLLGAKVRTKGQRVSCRRCGQHIIRHAKFPSQNYDQDQKTCYRRRGNGCNERLGSPTKLGCGFN